MSHPIVTSLSLAASVATGIATSQTLPGTAGLSLVLNGSLVTGGVATLDTVSRRVIITSAGNDSGITFTITGTRANGWANTALTETITGGNAAVATSTQDFLTVTSIVASAATASTVTAGTASTGGVASGPWVPWDRFPGDLQVSLYGVVLTGTPTWGVEYTYDDVFGLWTPSNITFPRALTLGTMTGITGTMDGQITQPVVASRLTISALSGAGGVQLTSMQQGY